MVNSMTTQNKTQILWNDQIIFPDDQDSQILIDYLQTYLSDLEENCNIQDETDVDGNGISVVKAEFWGEFENWDQDPYVEDWKLYLSDDSKIKSYSEADYYGCSRCGDGGCPSCNPQLF